MLDTEPYFVFYLRAGAAPDEFGCSDHRTLPLFGPYEPRRMSVFSPFIQYTRTLHISGAAPAHRSPGTKHRIYSWL